MVNVVRDRNHPTPWISESLAVESNHASRYRRRLYRPACVPALQGCAEGEGVEPPTGCPVTLFESAWHANAGPS